MLAVFCVWKNSSKYTWDYHLDNVLKLAFIASYICWNGFYWLEIRFFEWLCVSYTTIGLDLMTLMYVSIYFFLSLKLCVLRKLFQAFIQLKCKCERTSSLQVLSNPNKIKYTTWLLNFVVENTVNMVLRFNKLAK